MASFLIMTSRFAYRTGMFGLLYAVTFFQVAQAAPQVPPPRVPSRTIEFNRDVRPILSDKCFKCHGPGTQMRGLRLDIEDAAKQPLRDGRVAVVPGEGFAAPGYLRVSFARSLPELEAGARRIANFLTALRKK